MEFTGMDNTLTGYNTDINIGTIIQPPPSIYFGNNKEHGRLYWEDNIFKFEGNIDESAKAFIDFLSISYTDYHNNERKLAKLEVIDTIIGERSYSDIILISEIEKIKKEIE